MKMKKFINAPETITDEELVGLGLAYPDILDVDGHLVVSRDLAGADRVTIVTYGGSGHEPAQAGFVGKGMLDVQAVGDIFAAPNAKLVFEAMKLADKGHGVLLLTLNYAGDQLAGKQAMKLAKKAGLNVRQVVTGEEIQYDPNGEDNKRGLAGAVALYHIAAAAAREGKTLDEVAEIAQRYADSMASLTVKSTDATHPQNGMSFGDLGETDLMEIGAGQHGEGGGVRVPMMSSKDTVEHVAGALCKALDLKAGDKTFVMINGCGATTTMEMLVLFKDTVEFLKARDIEVVASMVGEILTVQEAGGFQMNIQEMATAINQELPLVNIVLNNNYLGMVRQMQDLFHNKRYTITCLRYHKSCKGKCGKPGWTCPEYSPNFVKIAEAYGSKGYLVTEDSQLEKTIIEARDYAEEHNKPVIIECAVSPEELVLPMIRGGASFEEIIY